MLPSLEVWDDMILILWRLQWYSCKYAARFSEHCWDITGVRLIVFRYLCVIDGLMVMRNAYVGVEELCCWVVWLVGFYVLLVGVVGDCCVIRYQRIKSIWSSFLSSSTCSSLPAFSISLMSQISTILDHKIKNLYPYWSS